MTDKCIEEVLRRYRAGNIEDLIECRSIEMTDADILALGHGCCQMQSIVLDDYYRVSDVGISALGHGCGQLQSISLGGCRNVTYGGCHLGADV